MEINATFVHTDTTLKEIEKTAILKALIRNNWKKLQTAKELGINKNTLRRKIVAYGIEDNSPRKNYEKKS